MVDPGQGRWRRVCASNVGRCAAVLGDDILAQNLMYRDGRQRLRSHELSPIDTTREIETY